MKTIILLGLMILASCSTTQSQTTNLAELRQETREILDYFNNLHILYKGRNAPKIGINMVEDHQMRTSQTIATCKYSPRPHIIVRRTLWEKINYNQKEYILFHELGHCILNRRHTTRTIEGVPASIMNEAYFSIHNYEEHRKAYMRELFMNDENVVRRSIGDRDYSLGF